MTLHKITKFYTELFSAFPNINSKFRIIAIFRSFVKQNSDSNKTCMYVHDRLLYQQTSFFKCDVLWVLSIKNMIFKIQPPSTFVISFFFTEVALLKVIHTLDTYQHTRFHDLTLIEFLTHLRSLNIRHFWMVNCMRLEGVVSRWTSMASHPHWIS
jgi:hypothetical protein